MSAPDSHLPYLLHALTPLHVGGEEGEGGIDLPTLRERHTGYPLVPGSSVKGVLREQAERRAGESVEGAFGPSQDRAGEHRGGLVFTDALLVALPVRSLFGTFAWLTCPFALARLGRDLRLAGRPALPAVSDPGSAGQCLVAGDEKGGLASCLCEPGASPPRVFLEDLDLAARPDRQVVALAQRLAAWAWPDDPAAGAFFAQRLAVVAGDTFGFFTRLGLEVRSRVKIDPDTGTAVRSGPWTEEHIPAEALLAGLAVGRPTQVEVRPEPGSEARRNAEAWEPERSLGVLRGLAGDGPVLRFGGHATIGLGRARLRLAG